MLKVILTALMVIGCMGLRDYDPMYQKLWENYPNVFFPDVEVVTEDLTRKFLVHADDEIVLYFDTPIDEERVHFRFGGTDFTLLSFEFEFFDKLATTLHLIFVSDSIQQIWKLTTVVFTPPKEEHQAHANAHAVHAKSFTKVLLTSLEKRSNHVKTIFMSIDWIVDILKKGPPRCAVEGSCFSTNRLYAGCALVMEDKVLETLNDVRLSMKKEMEEKEDNHNEYDYLLFGENMEEFDETDSDLELEELEEELDEPDTAEDSDLEFEVLEEEFDDE